MLAPDGKEELAARFAEEMRRGFGQRAIIVARAQADLATLHAPEASASWAQIAEHLVDGAAPDAN